MCPTRPGSGANLVGDVSIRALKGQGRTRLAGAVGSCLESQSLSTGMLPFPLASQRGRVGARKEKVGAVSILKP